MEILPKIEYNKVDEKNQKSTHPTRYGTQAKVQAAEVAAAR